MSGVTTDAELSDMPGMEWLKTWEPTPAQVAEVTAILNGGTSGRAVDPREHAVVYYAARDGLIKIGTSTEVHRRTWALKAELLATEPGSYELEHQRHTQFAESRVTGEWFRPAPELLRHIATLPAPVTA